MRISLLLIAACLLSWPNCYGQDEPRNKAAEPVNGVSELTSYNVELTEFRLKESLDPNLHVEKLAGVLREQKTSDIVELTETVRLSVLTNHESSVQFGKSVTVTVGAVVSANGRARSTQVRQVGTVARVTAMEEGGKVLLKLMYEASRNDGKGTDDSPPDVFTTKIETTILLKPDTPALIGGTSAEPSSYLLVTVSKQSQ